MGKPLGIKRLGALIIQDALESVLSEEADGIVQLFAELGVFAIDDRIDVLPQEHFQQRTGRAARPRAERAGDFGRQIAQHGYKAVRIAGECRQEMTVAFGPASRSKIGPVLV